MLLKQKQNLLFMLKDEARTPPYPSEEFIGHLRGKRGKIYFPHSEDFRERYKECFDAVTKKNIGVIVPDERETHPNSTHICLFINKSKENIALPLGIDEQGHISIITIKNIAENEQNPKWFYDSYNNVAKSRNMPTMERNWRPIN